MELAETGGNKESMVGSGEVAKGVPIALVVAIAKAVRLNVAEAVLSRHFHIGTFASTYTFLVWNIRFAFTTCYC